MKNRILSILKKIKAIVVRMVNMSFLRKIYKSFFYHLYYYRMINKKKLKLNLGSGDIVIDDFFSIDAHPLMKSDITGGVKKIKLNTNSVKIIYNSHILEHIRRREVRKVLKEWYRVLEPGGHLYISVPNVEVLYKIYLDNIDNYNNPTTKQLIDTTVGIIHGGQDYKFNTHYNSFSFNTLKQILKTVGFQNIKIFDPEKNIFQHNIMDGSKAIFDNKVLSLNVEAVKR